MTTVFLGIGSNLGDLRENCLNAVRLLEERSVVVLKKSSEYRSAPWGVREQPDFLNLCIEAVTDLSPAKLLSVIKEIEKELGRKETYRWGPRVVDIDILLYGDEIMDESGLKIPHPHMHERGFVMEPLSEIAPDVRHPVLKKTVKELSSLCELGKSL